jgi:hypothetical protein
VSDSVERLLLAGGDLQSVARDLNGARSSLPRRIHADPENVEKGLAQLVLTLIELLRQIMERQALHRMEAGNLTDEQIERLGETFMKLEQRMNELTEEFGLDQRDLNLNLGPLGNLL